MNKEMYDFFIKLNRIANRAVSKAQQENRQKGIPNVYCRNGKIYYELADGTLTNVSQF